MIDMKINKIIYIFFIICAIVAFGFNAKLHAVEGYDDVITIIAGALINDNQTIVIVERVSDSKSDEIIRSGDFDIEALKYDLIRGKNIQIYKIYNSFEPTSKYLLRPVGVARGRPHPEEGTAVFSPESSMRWLCVIQFAQTNGLSNAEYAIIDFPEIHDGIIQYKEDNRLGVDMDMFYEDIKNIHNYVRGNRADGFPVLKTRMAQSIVEKVNDMLNQ